MDPVKIYGRNCEVKSERAENDYFEINELNQKRTGSAF